MKKIFITLVITLISIFNVNADLLLEQEEIKNSNQYEAGETVVAEGKYDGISFVAGREVDVKSNSIFGALAGMNVRFSGVTTKDLFIAGTTLEINGHVQRDLYAGASEVKISGTVEGNIYVAAEKLTILEDAKINGNIKFYGTYLENKSTNIEGKITYYEGTTISGIDNIETEVLKQNKIEVSIKDQIVVICYSLLRSLFAFMIIAFLFPKVLKKMKTTYTYNNITDYLSTSGYGLISLIIIPIISILLLISNIGISVGLILGVLYMIMIYISTIASGYIVGNIISTKLIKKETNDFILGLIGIVSVTILSYIPLLGTLVRILTLFFGLGVIVKMLTNRENRTL